MPFMHSEWAISLLCLNKDWLASENSSEWKNDHIAYSEFAAWFMYQFCKLKLISNAKTRFSWDKYVENKLSLLLNIQHVSCPGGSFNFKQTFGPSHLS